MRSVPEWIGKTDDEKIPARVRLRVWERDGGRCWITGRKIMPGDEWDIDHKVALCNGGRHAEDNLAPALRSAHRGKTAVDAAEKSKIRTIKAKHIGARNKGPGRLQGRPFQKKPKQHWRSADELARMNAGDQPR